MTLEQWERNDWLKAEPATSVEIANLLAIVERDLEHAESCLPDKKKYLWS
jgi:hypothetical protein